MRPIQTYAISAADASVDQVSAAIPAQFIVAISVHNTSTGLSTGTIKVQASNDAPGPVDTNGKAAPASWVDIASQTVAITAASQTLIPKFDTAYTWLRIVYTHNNGSAGTITAKVAGFGLN